MTTLDLAYLLDFHALAEAGSFSRAAFTRNVTQPAFSRRIRALEDWAGVALFHRGASPVTLTEAGRAIRPALDEALRALLKGQTDARATVARAGTALHFAATHVLSFTFFPHWLRGLEGGQPLEAVQLSSDSLSACEQMMETGQVQFLLCHHHESAPVRLPPSRYLSVVVGADRLVPVTAPTETGKPQHVIPDGGPGAAPFLGYSAPSGLGRIVAAALPATHAGVTGNVVFTSHLAAALRSMALTGRGVAWLPQSLVAEDLKAGRLRRAGSTSLDIEVGIHLFRPVHPIGRVAERLWSGLAAAGKQA